MFRFTEGYFKTISLKAAPAFLAVMVLTIATSAIAGEPKPWGIGLQDAATPVKREVHEFHNLLMVLMTGVVVVVLGLLLFVMFRFNEKANPEPSKVTHNALIEVIWTVVPVCILLVIALPSFKVLYFMDRVADPDMTLEVTGYQWGWSYKYPDHGDIEFNADMIQPSDMAEYFPDGNGRRLLETYNPVVLPVDKNIEILVTARPNDVIHSWAMPAFGIKKDAVPGRLNHTWAKVEKTGVYFGQCSEICGESHAFMPISIYVVSEDEFNNWVDCVQNDESGAFYPSRACVRKLDLDKYRTPLKDVQRLEFARAQSE